MLYTKIYTVVMTMLIIFATLLENSILSALLMIPLLVGAFSPCSVIPLYLLTSLSGFFVAIPGMSVSRYLLFLLIVIVFLLKLQRKSLIKAPHGGLILLMILSSTYSTIIQNTYSTTGFYNILLNIAVIFIFSNINADDNKVKQVLNNTALSFSIAAITFSLISILSYDIGVRLSIGGLNPNSMGIIFVQIGTYLFAYSLVFNKNKGLMLTLVILSFAMVILTGSRAAFAAMSLGIIITYSIFLKNSGVNIVRIVKIVILSSISVFVLMYVVSIDENLASRLSIEALRDSQGAGRAVMIDTLIYQIIPENIWFGVGLGSVNEVMHLLNYHNSAFASHNLFISLLAQVGVIGFIIYFLFFTKITVFAIRKLSENNVLLIPLAIFFTSIIQGFGEIVFLERWFWNSFGLILFISNTKQK